MLNEESAKPNRCARKDANKKVLKNQFSEQHAKRGETNCQTSLVKKLAKHISKTKFSKQFWKNVVKTNYQHKNFQ